MHILDILVIFRLDVGQISFNLAENAFAIRQLALDYHQHRVLGHFDLACAEIEIFDEKVTYVFRHFDVWILFSPFLFLFFAAVIDLLLGLFAVKKL